MANILQDFINNLKPNGDLAGLKSAFSFIAERANIGKVVILNNDNTDVIFDNSNSKDTNPYTLTKDNISIEIFQDRRGSQFEDLEGIKALAMISLSYVLSLHIYSAYEKAPYISFVSGGLPNSFGFNNIITSRFNKEELIKNYSIFAINVRGFSEINRLYRVETGNLAIRLVAEQLKQIIHDDEILCHRGADDFVMLVKSERVDTLIKQINPIHINLKKNPQDDDLFLSLYLSIVVVPIDEDFSDWNDYISDAAVAMSYAKANRIPLVRLDKKLKADIETAKHIELMIDDEIKNKTIITYYQPKVDIRTGKIIGAEALARWQKDGNIIPPDVFIPILERTGDIAKLDLFMLKNACQDFSQYRDLGNETVPLSVNISQKDLLTPGFYHEIVKIIKKYKMNYHDIIIEITETTSLEEKARMKEFIDYLRDHHIKTSLDDFGTGYSSLSLLRDLMVNEIKIDRTFIGSVPLRRKDKTILKSIIVMATKLHLDVICEGVETLEQLEYLKSIGCYRVQGFYFDKPLPKKEFEKKLTKRFYDREIYKKN